MVQGRMFYFEAAKAAKEKGKLTPQYLRTCLKNYARMVKKGDSPIRESHSRK